MTRNVDDYWEDIRVYSNDTFKDFRPHFGISVNAQHALRDAVGTEHEETHQAHHDSWLTDRVEGCFQHHLIQAGAKRYVAGSGGENDLQARGFYASQAENGAKYAVKFFGRNVSIARETEIAALLVEGIDTPFTENDSRFQIWLDEWDNITIRNPFGNWRLRLEGQAEQPFNSGTSFSFDADETLHLRPPARFADEISNSRIVHELDIASGFKATVVGIRPDGTRETVTDSAEGMAWQLTGQHYTDKKLPEQTRFEITFSSE